MVLHARKIEELKEMCAWLQFNFEFLTNRKSDWFMIKRKLSVRSYLFDFVKKVQSGSVSELQWRILFIELPMNKMLERIGCFDFPKLYSSKCFILFIQVFVFIVQARYWLYNKNKHLDK